MNKTILISAIVSTLLFSGCNETSNQTQEKENSVKKSETIKPTIEKTSKSVSDNKSKTLKEDIEKKGGDFDSVKKSASDFSSALGGYISKKYNEASAATKEVYSSTKKSAEEYYKEVSGEKEKKENLEKKIQKLETDIDAKEKKQKQIFGNQLTKDEKDNLDVEKKDVVKQKSKLQELKDELDQLILDAEKDVKKIKNEDRTNAGHDLGKKLKGE